MKNTYLKPELLITYLSVEDIMDGSDVDIDVKDLFEESST